MSSPADEWDEQKLNMYEGAKRNKLAIEGSGTFEDAIGFRVDMDSEATIGAIFEVGATLLRKLEEMTPLAADHSTRSPDWIFFEWLKGCSCTSCPPPTPGQPLPPWKCDECTFNMMKALKYSFEERGLTGEAD